MSRNSVLLGLSFSLEPVIQADTAITQCCNCSRDFLTLETDRDILSIIGIKMVVYVKTGDGNAEWCNA